MRTELKPLRLRTSIALAVLVGAVLLLAGCGSSNSSSSSSSAAPSGAASTSATTSASSTSASSSTSACGKKPGVKATGTPIPIGTIDTKQPGTDFSDGPNMITAYYNCVNANGGVNGHPVKLYVIYDQTQPAQVAAAAKKLIQQDHVVGIVGVFDLLECTIDQAYWKQLGIIGDGRGHRPGVLVDSEQRRGQHGPAVQLRRSGPVRTDRSIRRRSCSSSRTSPAPATSPPARPRSPRPRTCRSATSTENVPINDANSVALDLVNKAGPNGWVVLNFTPPEALVILQAAQKLGLEDRVKGWGCSTPCNTDFLAKSLGPKWNHKLFVNAELTSPDDHNGPEMQLYKNILSQYGQSVASGLGSFSEMGYLLGKFSVDALDTVTAPYTIANVNAAFKNIKDEKTELLCQPWVYGNYPLHIPNNADFTTTPDNGKMVTAQGCFDVSSADPQIAQYRTAAGTAASTNPPTG